MPRTDYSWRRLALESAARMAEHDALPNDLRKVSNEKGIAYARQQLVERDTSALFGFK